MKLRSTIPCLSLALAIGGAGFFIRPETNTQPIQEVVKHQEAFEAHKALRPLADLIAKGEGGWDSVNRGWAGDTPGGMTRLTGRSLTTYTVGQVVNYQRGWLFAVGRYQFIPSTLLLAIRHSNVRMTDKFTPEVQDRLMAALIFHKRPAVGHYLENRHDNVGYAADEIAREWASIEYRSGRGYYDHVGGNRAKITRAKVIEILRKVKTSWHTH